MRRTKWKFKNVKDKLSKNNDPEDYSYVLNKNEKKIERVVSKLKYDLR